jgi:hypothetical protein
MHVGDVTMGAPMYSRDYILRLIERFARVLIALRKRLLNQDLDMGDVRAQLEEVAQQAGLDLGVARRLDSASLLMWLAPTPDYDASRLWLMAELLYLEGLHAGATSDGTPARDLERALVIFRHLPPTWRPSDDFETAAERVAEIEGLLKKEAGSW